ncbi:uroporphyrinogen-III synthase [Mesorhizobium sp. J18]|uniref:uroporphyrinogen-III synthase n=1 Tax=Mesorhizobium sp. J18 TaxID=935263 RepID=UPI001198CE94|nr:uroporphyrinogen-III synthase [Mesorhizobium sp. J18]TWG97992.1 uroporphyrinogen-III synthase [Mesorhizobium sp. J18]
MRRILVTRPEPGASDTARRLEAAGFEPVKLPLTRIEAIVPERIPDPSDYDVVAVTSANALHHAGTALIGSMAGRRCYAVGTRTAEAASRAGLAVQVAGHGDAETLAKAIVTAEPGGRIAYLCGRVRRDSFERILGENGLRVEAIETYDTLPVDYPSEALSVATDGNPIWGALVYSVAGALGLRELVAAHKADPVFARMRFFCISRRVADALARNGQGPVHIAERPAEEAMLRLLTSVD